MQSMDLINTVRTIKASGVFKKYVDFIQFPYYRNIDIDTRINFDFPLTIFTGQNGCGKSSALHALWGMPEGNTPYKFWFDTKIDPIEYFGALKRRHAFWYSFRDSKGTEKQVLKTRIKSKNDPNYWETSRPIKNYGMNLLGGARNKPIKKNTLYLDFRSELSAFDQFFYFGNVRNNKSKNRQEYIRLQSRKLKKLLDGSKPYQLSGNPPKSQNELLKVLTKKELEEISIILGRTYVEGKTINHTLFRNRGYSVYLKSSFAKYSEAFAGSGEVAVVRLVTEVMNAKNYSLIPLDEPEVSLHPGAQVRLQEFLLKQIKLKKHQIVLSTHSPSLISGLPKEAVKVFYLNPMSNKFSVKENLYPEEAFFHIQYEILKIPIFVEDRLAQAIIEAMLMVIGEEKANLFNVKYHAGGAEVITNQIIPHLSRNDNPNDYVIFDGDQKNSPAIDWRKLPLADITVPNLDRKIKEIIGQNIKFLVDGNSSGRADQKLKLQKAYLDFIYKSTFYFPTQTPEEMIWDEKHSNDLLDLHGEKEIKISINSKTDYKVKFRQLSKALYNIDDSDTIFTLQNNFLKKFIEKENSNYKQLIQVLNTIIELSNKKSLSV